MKEILKKIGKTISNITDNNIVICNRNKVIFSNISSLIDQEITENLKEIIVKRLNFKEFDRIEIINGFCINDRMLSRIIIKDSDSSGLIIIFGKEISDKAKICPNCSYPIKKEKAKENGKKILSQSKQISSKIFKILIMILRRV